MIIITHQNNKIINCSGSEIDFQEFIGKNLCDGIINISKKCNNKLLIWVHKELENYLNVNEFSKIFHSKHILVTYSFNEYMHDSIGYIENTPFVKVNKSISYPTWRMHQDVGGINSDTLNLILPQKKYYQDFNFLLHSIAKSCRFKGLFSYSNPKLLLNVDNTKKIKTDKASLTQLFLFVSLHFKPVWRYLLLLNILIYDKKFPLKSFLISLRKKNLTQEDIPNIPIMFNSLQWPSKVNFDLDVIIPTLGRKDCLYDVLKDLSMQTILPKRVIIIEQNPLVQSESELDYLIKEKWPFEIVHRFTHKTGACMARNWGLGLVKNKWVFLADDDNRFENDLIELVYKTMTTLKINCLTTAYLQKNEELKHKQFNQSSNFGSGNSFYNFEKLNMIRFDESFEFGYGEDIDFGMQIRNKGVDIIYTPHIKIIHLKAPSGGFRTKIIKDWDHSKIKPEPSPTIMLYALKHYTIQQLNGYKTIFFLNKMKNFNNKISILFNFNKKWISSLTWAKKLKSD
jgi:glycosyltransferase involved in cell wall biosynthesis